jgi:hypothetical protein
MKFNPEIFRKCAIIGSLTHEKPMIYQINTDFIEEIPIDSSLRNLLQTQNIQKNDFPKIARTVKEFTQRQMAKHLNWQNNRNSLPNTYNNRKDFNEIPKKHSLAPPKKTESQRHSNAQQGRMQYQPSFLYSNRFSKRVP